MPLPPIPGRGRSAPRLIEEIVAQLRLVEPAEQHRHQLVEARHQGRVGVDIDDVDLERLPGFLRGIARLPACPRTGGNSCANTG
jgi:hypothetical protein